MQPSSDEWWSITNSSGIEVSLHALGWSVATLGGNRYSVPPLRGENVQYAYVPGREFRAKMPDSRTITLVMWVSGQSNDGTANCSPKVQWNDNVQQLRKLLWTPDHEVTLTRRWWLTEADGVARLQVASAKVQLASPFELSMTGRTRADFSIDLTLSDPFFYGPEQTVEVLAGQTVVINNPGDYAAALEFALPDS